MRDLQEQVKLFCLHHGMLASAEHRLLDVMSELGEVAKEILKTTSYGKNPLETSPELKEELGDLVFAVMQFANGQNIDLEDAVRTAMKKYDKRMKEKGDAGSGH